MAGLGRRVFAAGEVLTAGNVMGYLQDQAVMNFAGTAARGSAVGTAVAEGMVSYLADSNTVEVYDGANWKGVGGLVPIVAPTVNISGGSAVANSSSVVSFTAAGTAGVSLNNVFSSRYANYRIVIDVPSASDNTSLQIRLRKNGADYSGTTYNFAGVASRSNGTQSGFVGTTANAWSVSWINLAGSRPASGTLDLFSPFATTSHRMVSSFVGGDGTSMANINVGGNNVSGQSANDGITLYPVAGTITGTIQVFAYGI